MAYRQAKFTQADIARATRAAMQAGAGAVRLLPDGTIQISLQPEPAGEKSSKSVEPVREIVL